MMQTEDFRHTDTPEVSNLWWVRLYKCLEGLPELVADLLLNDVSALV